MNAQPHADRGSIGARLISHARALARKCPRRSERNAMTTQRTEGPTPAGGAYAIARFFDDEGRAVDRTQATCIVVTEYTAEDEPIEETWFMPGRAAGEGDPRLRRGARTLARRRPRPRR